VRAGDGADAPATPLQLFMPLLSWLRDQCREHGAEETSRLLGANAILLAELEPSLARLPGADAWPAPAPLPPAAARERHVRAVLDAIARLAEMRPLLLTLDDLQWADDLSMAVLEAMSEAFVLDTPVVVLAAFRGEEAPEALHRLSSRPWVQRIQLRRLTASEVGSVAGDMLASTHLVPRIIEYVHTQSEGVPFFVAEYLRAMTEEGVLKRAAGQWRVADGSADALQALNALPVPGALTDIVRRRLSRLPEECRAALEAGAVLGRRFRLLELSTTTTLDAEGLSRLLARAVDHRLLEAEPRREYRFPHDKIRETLYADLPEPRRRQLHGAAGAAICDLFCDGEGLEERYGVVAHHFRKANMIARAVPFLGRAGERALQLSASADAVTYLREALALEASLAERMKPLTRAMWYRMLGQALQGLGRVKDSVEPLESAIELLGARVPTGGRAFAPVLLREMGMQAAQRMRRGPKRASSLAPDQLELGRTLDAVTQAYFYTGENLGFMLAALKTVNVFEGGPASAELALAYGHAAATASFVIPSLAPRYFELAHSTLRELENPSTESHVEMLHGLTCVVAGKRVEADRHLARSLELADRARHYRRWDECASLRASYLLMTGPLSDAEAMAKRLESSARRRGDDQMTAWSLLIRGLWAIRTWQPELAAELQANAQRFENLLAPADRIWLTAQGAHVAYLMGDVASARTRIEQASTLIAYKPPPQPHLATAVAMFAETLLAMALEGRRTYGGDLREAGRACETLMATARMHTICMPEACLHQGTHLWHTGRVRAARRAWRRGLSLAQAREFPYEEARIESALARTATSAPESAGHLERVDHLVQCLGIPRASVIRPSSTDRT
jgi:tetratricopeptide (TPR) repeat protein